MDTKTTDLRALNSATKYPSILTYHKLGERGRLTDVLNIDPQGSLVVTEKVDGTNTRVIFMPDGYFLIGSREHLLYAKGDLIGNPALGIVESIKDLAEQMGSKLNSMQPPKTTPAIKLLVTDCLMFAKWNEKLFRCLVRN